MKEPQKPKREQVPVPVKESSEPLQTFYRIRKISKFEYASEAVEVPASYPRTEPVKRNLRGIVLARLFDLFEK